MNAAAAHKKLSIRLGNSILAALLVRGGFLNPRSIRDATDQELLAISGIGEVSLAQIRAVFPEG